MAAHVTLQMGSLTYGDRRWQGFDAATLAEVSNISNRTFVKIIARIR